MDYLIEFRIKAMFNFNLLYDFYLRITMHKPKDKENLSALTYNTSIGIK